MVIDDDQGPQASPVKELIRDKVHAPALVLRRGRLLYLTLDTGDTPTWLFPSYSKAFATIEPVDPLMVHLPPFASKDHVKPAVSVAHPNTGELPHTHAKSVLAPADVLMSVRRARIGEGPTGLALARLVGALDVRDDLPAYGRP